MKSLSVRLLAASAFALVSLSAAAQYNGFHAAITKQLSPVNINDPAIVELGTLVPLPYQLQFQSLSSPSGVVFKDVKTTATCPDARDARKCRQYFTMAVDATTSKKCTLTGDYVAKFNVVCQPGTQDCKTGKYEIPFQLQSENFCSETNVSTAKFWTRISGVSAADVGAGSNYYLMWFLDASKTGTGGFDVVSLAYDRAAAMRRAGKAVRIDVDEQGNGFVANDKGEMYRFANGGWHKLPGLAKDVGIGADGTAWCIGMNPVPGGFGIYRWNKAKNDWDTMPGGGVRIDVDPTGKAWVVNDAGQIWRWTGANWVNVPGLARDVGIGNKGAVFVAGADGIVYQWDEKAGKWNSRGGANVTDITVDSDGAPVVINAAHEVFVGQP